MISNQRIRLVLFWVVIIAWALTMFTSCTKNYKCSRYNGLQVVYNPKEQSCYYTAKGDKTYLKKEQCASLCYED
jgi:hypothetical protein